MNFIDRHPWITGTTVGSIFLMAVLILAEGYLRFKNTPSLYMADSEIGWVAKKNYHGVFQQTRLDGSAYSASIETNELGLRSFNSSGKGAAPFRILVLGDSYSMDPYASDAQMWWAVLAEQLALDPNLTSDKVEVLAGGAGGYGTLQNLLLARRLKANQLPQPDLFVLQFCSNDFVNNHREWEATTIVHNQAFSRPYYEANDAIRFSDHILAPIWRTPFAHHSRLFNYLDLKLQGLFYKTFGGYGQVPSSVRVARFDQESLQITSALLKAVREEFSETLAIMVNCDSSNEGLNRYWVRLAIEAGFAPLEQPALSVFNESERKAILFNRDGGHFSPEGNQIFGVALSRAIIEHCFVGGPSCSQK
jgi:lysophospholipase L1-like esterase